MTNRDSRNNSGRDKPLRRKRGRWLNRIAMLALVALAAVAALTSPYWLPVLKRDADARHILAERASRLAQAKAGLTLNGVPNLANLAGRLAEKGLKQGAPILVRIFKREFELELWMQRDGRFEHFVTYPICMWSGALGPKLIEGDGQSPEGFYSVDKTALNPNSKYYRSFNVGYPNAFDRAMGRTGSFVMVHGNCLSVGCFAMTDAQMDEIWRLVTAALDGGQGAFQVQTFPFRMTEANLAAYEGHQDHAFWRDLKVGYDIFEATRLPVRPSVCAGRYAFEAARAGQAGDVAPTERCPEASAKN